MSDTAAHPDHLDRYLRETPAPRDDTRRDIDALVNARGWLDGSCVTHGVKHSNLQHVRTMLGNTAANDEFVRGVRDALVAADQLGDVVVVSDATLRATFASGDYDTEVATVGTTELALLGGPATSGFVDDPICAANGNFIHVDHDIAFPALSSVLDISRSYNSLAAHRDGAFGHGWTSIFDVRLRVSGGMIVACLVDGAEIRFVEQADGSWNTTDRRRHELIRRGDELQLVQREAAVTTWRFDLSGSLLGWSRDGSAAGVDRRDGRIVGLRSAASERAVAIDWLGSRITALRSDDGRTVSYEYDDEGNLTRAVSPWADIAYVYAAHHLVTRTDADGVAIFQNVYDDAGRVVEQTSEFGRVTSYRYQMPGATVITDEAGVRQSMVHDARGNLTAIIDVDGSAMRLTYDTLNRMVRVVDQLGAVTTNEFDGDSDRIARRVDPDGASESWRYDDHGRVVEHTLRSGARYRFDYRDDDREPVEIIDPNGAVTHQTLDERGLPVEIVDPDGVALRYTYDRDGQIASVVDAHGHTVEAHFDSHGTLRQLVDQVDHRIEFDYDLADRLSAARLGDGEVTFGYSAAGRPVEGSAAGGVSWSMRYGAHGAATAISDALGSVVGFEHDTHGNVVEMTAPDGAVTRFGHTEVGLPASVVEPDGAVSRIAYDRAGRPIEATDALGNTTRLELDVLGRPIAKIDPDGLVTRRTFHPDGQLATLTGRNGATWATEVDAVGRVIALVVPDGGRTVVTYSAAGRLTSRTTPEGRTERFVYDDCGRMVEATDAQGRRVRFDYDRRGLLHAMTRPDGVVERYEWDANRRVVAYRVGDEAPRRLERDGGGRVVAAIDPTGVRSEFSYDQRGLLASARDAAGHVTTYRRDARGRLASLEAPGGRTTTYRYGTDGHVSNIVDPAGVTTEVARDLMGRVTSFHRHTPGDVGEIGWSRVFDEMGREVERRAADGSLLAAFSHDALSRIVGANAALADTAASFEWDPIGNLAATSDATGRTDLRRDRDGRLLGWTDPSGSATSLIRHLDDEVTGLIDERDASIVRPDEPTSHDAAGRLLAGADGSVYRYDDAGRLVELARRGGTPTTFTYDDAGLIDTETAGDVTRRFTYDVAGRVASVEVGGVGVTHIDYDGAGRRTTEAHPDGSTTRYLWNDLDKLVGIVNQHADGSTTEVSIDVDALGRPVRVNGQAIGYDPVSGRPNVIGTTRLMHVGRLRWDSASKEWMRVPEGVADGLRVGDVTVLGARTLDPVTNQFLSPDPLLVEPGTNGAASAYTYAWQDPVNFVDPSGLKPISIEDYRAVITREEQGLQGSAIEFLKSDMAGWIMVAGVVVAAAAITIAFPVGGVVIAGALVGMGASAAQGIAAGDFSPHQMALGGLLGMAGGGASAALVRTGAGVAVTVGAQGAVGAGSSVVSQLAGGEPGLNWNDINWRDVAVAGTVSAGSAGVGGMLDDIVGTSVTRAAASGAATDFVGNSVEQLVDSTPGYSWTDSLISAGGGSITAAVDVTYPVPAPNTPSPATSATPSPAGSGSTGSTLPPPTVTAMHGGGGRVRAESNGVTTWYETSAVLSNGDVVVIDHGTQTANQQRIEADLAAGGQVSFSGGGLAPGSVAGVVRVDSPSEVQVGQPLEVGAAGG